MKVAKWGNSLAVRLPREVVARLGLKEGDEIELASAAAGRLEIVRDREREEALARIRAMRAPLPHGYKFDRGEIYDDRGFGLKPDDPDER